jgi:hypothetical protein
MARLEEAREGRGGVAGAGEGAGEGAARSAAIGEVVREALLSNANLGGDCVNRGMLLGALLGLVVGERNLPRDLVEGLCRREEVRGAVEAFGDLAARQVEGVAGASTNLPTTSPRFGRPWPLPVRALFSRRVDEETTGEGTGAASLLSGSGVPPFLLPRPPRDFATKIARMREEAARAGVADVRSLRYMRTSASNPLVAVPLKGGGVRLEGVVGSAADGGGGDDSAVVGVGLLEAGDAARDRAEVLAELARRADASGSTTSAAEPAPAADDLDGAQGPPLPVGVSRDDHRAIEAAVDAPEYAFRRVLGQRNEAAVESEPGTGIFYFPDPRALARRLAAVSEARRVLLSRGAGAGAVDEDPVSVELLRDYGVRVPIRTETMVGREEVVGSGSGACDA